MADAPRIVHIDIPSELHRRVRLLAAERDETQKALVVRAIEREVERLERARDRGSQS